MQRLYYEKTQGFQKVLIGSYWCGEARGRLTGSWASYVIGLGNIFGFLCLVLIWKQRPKLRKLEVLDQVLTVLGQLLQRLWVRVLLLYMV